jgi:TIR domain
MSSNVHKRDFDIFLSHAHNDKQFVDYLDNWLTEFVGFNVWYDSRELSAGALLASDLQKAIQRCRGILIVVTDIAMQKGWVKAEYNSAMDEKANNPDFRVIALRVDNANVDELMRGITWIDIQSKELSAESATLIIKAFYPGEKRPNPKTSKDIYVSCSWRNSDNTSAITVMKKLMSLGIRLIGDSEDQETFGEGNRIERIISSCGAFISIIPFRDENIAKRGERPYKYFLEEIDFANKLGVPALVISDPRIKPSEKEANKWFELDMNSELISDELNVALENLFYDWKKPISPQYIFCAMDLDDESKKSASNFRSLIERVTGMETIVGTEITKEPLQRSIISSINNSFLTIADITNDSLNTCIEAGIAIASNTNVALISFGAPRRPPFMLRSLQLYSFSNEAEKIGLIHKVVWPYRRRIINAEL